MKSTHRIMRSIALLRWWLPVVVLGTIVGLAAIAALGWVVPRQRVEVARLRDNLRFLATVDVLPAKVASAERAVALLDSLARAVQSRPVFEQASALQTLYALVDSTRCKASKIEVGKAVPGLEYKEIPVTLTGNGPFQGLGDLLAGIENLPFSTRIRQVSVYRKPACIVSFSVDFVVVE
jgi:hypothetical protein